MKRGLSCLSLMLLITILCGCRFTIAETRQPRKMVYVVLDDSGSMQTDNRWPRALYAMEVLSGLLNPNDQLEFYYLNYKNGDSVHRNDPFHWSANLTQQHINDTLKQIVETTDLPNGNTPFTPVEKAFEDMVSESKKVQFDQYWLVVLTDGQYNESNISPELIRNKFEGYVKEKIGPKGDGKLQLIYCTIGDNTYIINPTAEITERLRESGIFCYSSANSGIIPVMGQIADQISGRSRFTGSSYLKQTNSNTLQIDSQIPLFNFVVLVQGTQAKLNTVFADSRSLMISRSAAIVPPAKSDSSAFLESLSGGIYTVDNGQNHINAGTYSLVFDRDVTADQIIVLFEPALEIHLDQYVSGRVIQGEAKDYVHVGQKFEISPVVLEYGTNQAIPLNKLPAGSTIQTEIINGTQQCTGDANNRAVIDIVADAPVRVRAVLSIPGFNDIVYTTEFVPIQKPTIEATISDNQRSGVQNRELIARTEELKAGKKEKYVDFKVFVNGIPAEDIQALLQDGTLVLTKGIPCEEDYSQKGILRLYPRYNDSVALNQPLKITLHDSENNLIEQATVTVLPSEYSVKVNPENYNIKEAEFRDKPVTFDFTLVVDGKDVNAGDYEALSFAEINNKDISIKPARDGKKWRLTLEYKPGMATGVYQIVPIFQGQRLDKTATLNLEETSYLISVKPESITLRQSELESGKHTFQVTLKEENKQISPDVLAVDWGGFYPGNDSVDTKGQVRTLEVTGDLTTQPGTYEIIISYTSSSGHETKKTVSLTVEKSSYTIVPYAEQQLVFSTPQEMEANEKEYRFDIQVDGRSLSDEEMQKVTTLPKVDRGDTVTVCKRIESGYIVVPKAPPGWVPSENKITYEVACSAGDQTASLKFYYNFVEYSVVCVGGDGVNISAALMNSNTTGLAFRVYGDGIPLPYDMINNNFTVSVPSRFGILTLDSLLTNDADGACTVYITPATHHWNFIDLFTKPFVPTGDMPITVQYKHTNGTGTVILTAGSLLDFWPHAVVLLLLLLALVFYRKKRFGKGACMYYFVCSVTGKEIRGNTVKQKQRWKSKHLKPDNWLAKLNPFGREKVTVKDLSVYASSFGTEKRRRSRVEVYIKPGNTVKEIRESVDLEEVPKIDDPIETPALSNGWFSMSDGAVIAVYGTGSQVILYKYFVDKSKKR